MAKMAAALHILVKEEKLALDLLEQIKNRVALAPPDKVYQPATAIRFISVI